MATNVGDDDFDEYDKPGAERSRRRRREDDDLDSDLEEDLLEEDWLSSKKNPSELSDEELNDDLLQSDEEDQTASGKVDALSLNATLGLDASGDLNDEDPEGEGYPENTYNETEGFSQDGVYEGEEYQRDDEAVEFSGEQNYEGYQDEVLDLQIDEPLDDDFQVDEYTTAYSEEQTDQQKMEEEEEECETEEQNDTPVTELEEVEGENDPEAEGEFGQDVDVKEESDDEEEDDEESGRQRFKTERKDTTVVRLSDATSKRRNIPETLELSEEAKADLQDFEEKERQRKQGRFGGRGRSGPRTDGGRGGMLGRGGVRGRGVGGRGGRGEFPLFGRGDFRGDGGRGRIHEQRPPLMQVNLGLQQQLRMTPQLQHHHHHHQSRLPSPRGSGGPGLFPDPGGPIPQQPLQLLMPHLPQRSPGPSSSRAQHDTHRPRLISSPPRHAHISQHQQHQQHQPKNIHINPHFRGPSSSPVQVPSMAPMQNHPRPNIAPQRLPTPPDFQPHLQGNFGPPQRPLPLQEQWRGPPPHQDREHFFPGEPRFPGQHMFDQPGPTPLMNTSVLPMPGQGPPSFSPQGGLGGPGFGPLGLGHNQGPQGGGVFQRDPPRPGLASQHAGPPGPPGPRGFVGHRQPFTPQQQGPPFSPQHMPFGMQGLMQQHSQPLHLDPPLSHQPLQQQQQHRQNFPPQGLPHSQPPPQHQQLHQHHSRDQHSIVHLSPPHFRQPVQSGHRPMQPRPQGTQQRNNHPRPRMTSSPLQQITPQRNSNLRELPIATGNSNIKPLLPSGQAKPVTRAAQSVRPGQAARPGHAGRGGPVAQGQSAIKVQQQQTSAPEIKKEHPAAQSSTTLEDPDEDEETRQYRLKIEEQKRLREEILRRKEQRRQMQAGKRKKELMERISNQNQTPQTQNPSQPLAAQPSAAQPSAAQPPQPVPSLISNGTTQNLSSGPGVTRPNVKACLQNTKPQAQVSGWSGPQIQLNTGPDSNQQGQWQPPQKRTINPQTVQRQSAVQTNLVEGHGPAQPQPGVKRTVMQRANSTESPQVPQKVRVVKLLGETAADPNTGPSPQQQQPIGRPAPQQRLGPIRRITMATGGVQNQQQAGRGMANQTNRMVVRGRGRGGGRMMMQQSQRAQDPLPSTVCIEGLSTNTTNKQLMNLLNSIGPVETFTMLPEQRKAVAKFVNPQHALSFQHSFHRHMIDLSHIDVSIIDG